MAYLEELLHLLGVHRNGQAIGPQGRVEHGVLVHVLQQDGGADGGPVVQARAAVAMPARACAGVRGGRGRCELGGLNERPGCERELVRLAGRQRNHEDKQAALQQST